MMDYCCNNPFCKLASSIMNSRIFKVASFLLNMVTLVSFAIMALPFFLIEYKLQTLDTIGEWGASMYVCVCAFAKRLFCLHSIDLVFTIRMSALFPSLSCHRRAVTSPTHTHTHTHTHTRRSLPSSSSHNRRSYGRNASKVEGCMVR